MRQSGRRTQNYNGKYTNKSGQTSYLGVKIFSGLAASALLFILVKNTAPAVIDKFVDKDDIKKPTQEEMYMSEDMILIENILKENPDMLKTRESGVYTIKFGDTLSEIAQENGITLKRLLSLNSIENPSYIRDGQTIKVETVKPLEEIDQEMKILESYFYDYVFNSEPAKIARGIKEVEHKEAQMLCKSLIYGNPKSEADVDPYSIYGRYVNAYLNYHEHPLVDNEEKKQEYVATLIDVQKDLLDKNSVLGLVEYEQFKVYCINGNVKDQEIVEKHTTVYD